MKNFALLLVLIAASLPARCLACEPTSAQMADYWQRNRHSEENYVIKLAHDADQIFTGIVIDVTELAKGRYVQLAHIQVETSLKGNPGVVATVKMYLRVNPERDNPNPSLESIPACGETADPVQHDPYVNKTFKYLFYVKGGVLLRANPFPVGPPLLQPNDEIKFLKQHAHL